MEIPTKTPHPTLKTLNVHFHIFLFKNQTFLLDFPTTAIFIVLVTRFDTVYTLYCLNIP